MDNFEKHRQKTLRSEAAFAFSYLSQVLPSDGQVLEVGAGAGFLASLFQQSGRQMDLFEPISSGFESSKELQVEDLNWLESLPQSGDYMAIIANHVIEHIPDWESVLKDWVNLLAPGGKIVLLFPNYTFPYEPHFGVPFLFSKKLTWLCFSRKIITKRPNSKQMFEELSVPRAKTVQRHLNSLGLETEIDRRYAMSYLERSDDDAFFERKGRLIQFAMGSMAGLLKFTFERSPRTWLPVVAIHAIKRDLRAATK